MVDDSLIQSIENLTGHAFQDLELLLQALTHTSYANERNRIPVPHYERLEFLGDAVIGLVVAQELMTLFPEADEGLLSRWRSSMVSRRTLADIATEIQLGTWLRLGKGERQTGGDQKLSILAGAFEGLIGALFLDAGYDRSAQFVVRVFEERLKRLTVEDLLHSARWDKKTYLQEKTQSIFRSTPVYKVVDTWGKDHEKEFRVEIELQGMVIGTGEGKSKKEAEQRAAQLALDTWESWEGSL